MANEMNSKEAAKDYGWEQIKNGASISDVLDDVWEMGFRNGLQTTPEEDV